MSTDTIWIQAVTLVSVVLIIDVWERKRPGYKIDRKASLPLDLIAIGVVIVFGEVWKFLIVGGMDVAGLTAEQGFVAPLSGLPIALKIFLAVALADLALYWVHRAMHDLDFLWPTHRFHHSITQLYWLSGARTSVLHLFLFAAAQMSVAYLLFGLTPAEASIAFSFGVVVNIWVHANIKVDLGPVQWLIITPDYHRIHHASDERSRKNLAFVFTLWDRAFGTYVDPRSIKEPFTLGSAEPDKGVPRQILGV